ncbi:MAG TPA: hypothetical protein VNT25_07720 [Allosphingosinicella sp.]|nr:hypothetical protein [Allosphingosinicella sp.]
MQEVALLAIAAFSLWLIAVGFVMAFRSGAFLRVLRLTATSHRINLTEQGLRLLFGAALLVRAPSSKLPELFEPVGWFVVATSILLMVLPLHLHSQYAIWWSERLSPQLLGAIAPLSVGAGVALLFLAI